MVRRHGPLVWRIVNRILGPGAGGQSDAADCFQEVFVAALEVARREKVKNWEALLRRIATARGLDLLRTRIRERARRGIVEWEEVAEAASVSPEAGLERAELARELREALAQLKPEDAELFCLRFLEEASYEEIAEQMEMSVATVGVTLHRVKEKLRGMLARRKVSGEVRDE